MVWVTVVAMDIATMSSAVIVVYFCLVFAGSSGIKFNFV